MEGHHDRVCSVSLTPDGRYAVSASNDKTLRVWDLESGQCLRTLEGHTEGVVSVSLTPDGQYAVSGSEDNTLRVWDMKTGRCLHIMEGHEDDVNSIAITPESRYAVSGSSDKDLRMWDLVTGQYLHTQLPRQRSPQAGQGTQQTADSHSRRKTNARTGHGLITFSERRQR